MQTALYKELNAPLDPVLTELNPKLPKLPGIRAVIFDIYGTLVVSRTGDISIAQAIDKENELRAILENAGVSPDLELNLTDLFYTLIKEDHAVSKAKGAQYPEVDILKIWTRLIKRLQADGQLTKVPEGDDLKEIAIRFECVGNPVWPMPGLKSTLKELKDAGLALGIVSNAQFYTPIMLESFSDQSLDQLGFQSNLSVWSYREGLGKPSIELFETLKTGLEVHGIQASEALYVGNDMLNDIWTANQAGLKTALFAGDQRSLRLRESDERCKDLTPDAILTELIQTSQLL